MVIASPPGTPPVPPPVPPVSPVPPPGTPPVPPGIIGLVVIVSPLVPPPGTPLRSSPPGCGSVITTVPGGNVTTSPGLTTIGLLGGVGTR